MPSATPPAPRSSFLAEIFKALDADWDAERRFTARVATLAALEFSLAQIAERLDVPAVRVRDAFIRLRRVAPQLIREESTP